MALHWGNGARSPCYESARVWGAGVGLGVLLLISFGGLSAIGSAGEMGTGISQSKGDKLSPREIPPLADIMRLREFDPAARSAWPKTIGPTTLLDIHKADAGEVWGLFTSAVLGDWHDLWVA